MCASLKKNRYAERTCALFHIAHIAAFCLPRDSSCLCVIFSPNSTRYFFGIVNHYSAMVDFLGK